MMKENNMNTSHQKLWPCLIVFIVLVGVGENVSAQPLLSESDIAPCEELLTKARAVVIKRATKEIQKKGRSEWAENELKITGGTLLEFALGTPPYSPLYDLESTQQFIKSTKENVAILQSGDKEKMSRKIGREYRGQDLEDRMAYDSKFLCMLNVRLAQLKGKSGPKPKVSERANGAVGDAPR